MLVDTLNKSIAFSGVLVAFLLAFDSNVLFGINPIERFAATAIDGNVNYTEQLVS